MQENTLKRLRETVGAKAVLTEPEELLRHSGDATKRTALPEAVVCPESVEQVAAVARFCSEERIPLTPRGAGTGLAGGAVPSERGILLSLSRMKSIREVVSGDLYAVVEAGVVTEVFRGAVKASSLFYPPDPASQSECTIGGNVATSASGLSTLKYGTTKNYLLGLEVVLPTGEVMETGSRTVKNVAGYDLTRLICGSEGTLAIVTAATLKLIPLPEHRVTVLAAFRKLEEAARASSAAVSAGVTPSILDIMDPVVLGAISRRGEPAFPGEIQGHSLLLAETDGFKETAEMDAERIEGACSDSGAVLVRRSSESVEAEKFWTARRGVLPALGELKPAILLGDVTVPVSRVVEMVDSIAETARRHALTIATFGHAGAGSLHPAFLLDAPVSVADSSVERAVSELSEMAVSVGGTLSEEYGIGTEKAGFLEKGMDEQALETMRRLKKAFDPEQILNPGRSRRLFEAV